MRTSFAAVLAATLCAAAPAAAHESGVYFSFDRMDYFDSDHDGRVSRDEFFRSAPEYNGPVFIFADLDNDGYLTRRELHRAERRVRRHDNKRRRRKH